MNDHLQLALEVMKVAVGSMTHAELERGKPGKWSAAQIVEHVALACGGTSRMLRWFLDTGKLMPDKPNERHLIMAKFVIEEGNFPPGQTAPPFAQPRGAAPNDVLPALSKALAGLDGIIVRCEQRFGTEVTLGRHMILGPLTGQQWCRFHLVHSSHHAKQIEEIKQWVRDGTQSKTSS